MQMEFLLESRAVPPFMKNGFVLACPSTRQAAIIDPGDEVDQLVELAASMQVDVRAILLTHAHVDHVSGVATAREAFGAPVHLHRDDLFLYERAVQQGAMFGLTVGVQPPVDVFFEHGMTLDIGTLRVRVHHTPGHCPGEVCLQVGPSGQQGRHLFVGDSLFAGSIGRTDLPGGDYDVLMRSIVSVIFPLGDDGVVYPGHGPTTTVLRERTSNPFVLDYLSEREG
jgi:glyoxylase-like metal-dependent hydrolase (beta-lactamase superfamily II)